MGGVVSFFEDTIGSVFDVVGDAMEWVGETAYNVVKQAIENPIQTALMIGVTVATGGTGAGAAALGLEAPLTALEAAIAKAAISGVSTAVKGGDLGDVLTSAATSFAVSQGLRYVSDSFKASGTPGEGGYSVNQYLEDGTVLQNFYDGSKLSIGPDGSVTPMLPNETMDVGTQPISRGISNYENALYENIEEQQNIANSYNELLPEVSNQYEAANAALANFKDLEYKYNNYDNYMRSEGYQLTQFGEDGPSQYIKPIFDGEGNQISGGALLARDEEGNPFYSPEVAPTREHFRSLANEAASDLNAKVNAYNDSAERLSGIRAQLMSLQEQRTDLESVIASYVAPTEDQINQVIESRNIAAPENSLDIESALKDYTQDIEAPFVDSGVPPVAEQTAVVEQPPVAEPTVAEPTVAETPAYTPPAYEPPAYEPPAYTPPAYEQPAYTPPAYEPPAYEQPAYEQPAYETDIEDPFVDFGVSTVAEPTVAYEQPPYIQHDVGETIESPFVDSDIVHVSEFDTTPYVNYTDNSDILESGFGGEESTVSTSAETFPITEENNIEVTELHPETHIQHDYGEEIEGPFVDSDVAPDTEPTDSDLNVNDDTSSPTDDGKAPVEDRDTSGLPSNVERPLTDSLNDLGKGLWEAATADPWTTAAIIGGGLALSGLSGNTTGNTDVNTSGSTSTNTNKTYTYGEAAPIRRTGLQELYNAASKIYGEKYVRDKLGIEAPPPEQYKTSYGPLLSGQAPGAGGVGLGYLGQGFGYTQIAPSQTFDISSMTPEQIVMLQDMINSGLQV